MVLRVKFTDFPEAAQKYAETSDVFFAEIPGGVAVTSSNSSSEIMVSSTTSMSVEECKAFLDTAGMKVLEGSWSSDDEDMTLDQVPELYVVAVTYRSRELQPGIWVDAYPYQPKPNEVLQSLYEEFVLAGEVKAVGFDEFLRLSQANLIVLGPEQLRGYALQKSKVEKVAEKDPVEEIEESSTV